MTTYEHKIEKVDGVIRIDAVVVETEDDGHSYAERLSAIWCPEVRSPDTQRWIHGGYWLVSGDNSGSQQLIVYPHGTEPLRNLLTAMDNALFAMAKQRPLLHD